MDSRKLKTILRRRNKHIWWETESPHLMGTGNTVCINSLQTCLWKISRIFRGVWIINTSAYYSWFAISFVSCFILILSSGYVLMWFALFCNKIFIFVKNASTTEYKLGSRCCRYTYFKSIIWFINVQRGSFTMFSLFWSFFICLICLL